MLLKEKFSEKLKYFLNGIDIKIFDDILFKISNKNLTGWMLGNKMRSISYGKKKYISDLKIIFISGSPRSGTSLLQMMLKTFDGIDGAYQEFCIFNDIKEYDFIENEFNLDKRGVERLGRIGKNDLNLLTHLILKKYKEKNNLKYVLLKTPKYIIFINEIFKYFPNSKFINIVRDGRDASLSMEKFFSKVMNKKFPFDYGVKNWAASIKRADKFNCEKNYLEVRYEDLIENPHQILKEISLFLNMKGIKIEEALNFYKKIDPKKVVETHKKQLMKPLYKEGKNRWKKDMSPSQKKIFKKIAGEILIKKGYEKDNSW